ncbi:hypothetical protein FDENT_9957 [Fusarium denticulatum]|uniref:Uncharacterized protein n=1 Tax=Fusarium denticulatum TaxID=48507 RepID=A0A8H5WWH8_9HYPO|nr:hypothetical protein FDENT_9957 [Fusarium denticulatum]
MDSEIDESNSSRSVEIVCSADCELVDSSIRQPEEAGFMMEKVLSSKHNRMILSSADQFTSRERQQHKPYVGKKRRRVDSSTRRPRLADKSSACRRILLKAAQRKVRELQMALESSLNENLRLVEELSWWRLSNAGLIPPNCGESRMPPSTADEWEYPSECAVEGLEARTFKKCQAQSTRLQGCAHEWRSTCLFGFD